MSPLATTSRRYSGRTGGAAGHCAALIWVSAMMHNLLFLDAVGKQQLVNAVRQLVPADRVGPVAAVAVKLALDLTGMRGEQKDAVADEHGFGNRVGDEQHGEPRLAPQRQQLLL